MKVSKAKVSNFGSFKELDFDFQDGLTLIYGATGAGKSTIMDIVSWVLYGETSKNGAVDDVRAWDAAGITKGEIELELSSGNICVTRIRGSSAKQNDLYWWEHDGWKDPVQMQMRGKDVTETTKLLEKRTGINSNLYHSRAIYNDSSISGRFFTAKSKERRQLLEQVANLDFPVKLSEKLKDESKCVKKEYDRTVQEYRVMIAKLGELEQLLADTRVSSHEFEQKKFKEIQHLEEQINKYNYDNIAQIRYIQDRIETLTPRAAAETCAHCGNVKTDKEATNALCRLQVDLEHRSTSPNPFHRELERVKASKDPYYKQIDNLTFKIDCLEVSSTYEQMRNLEDLVNSLETLKDTTDTMRGLLLEQAVSVLQTTTNNYLEKYFDSELKVSLALEGSDNLTTEITKNGHTCPYTQLSKGQKSLLKLCFALAVGSVAANRAGVHIDTLFLDEPFDGQDATLKAKGYNLLQALSLEHKSVYVIDHAPGFQELFPNKIKVEMVGDHSHASQE